MKKRKKRKKEKKWKVKWNAKKKKKKKKKKKLKLIEFKSDGRVTLNQVVTLKEVSLSLCYPFLHEPRT